MKRVLFILITICSMLTSVLSVSAQTELDLVAERIKEDQIGNDSPRGPVNAPSASIDDHTFYINESHPGYVLQLVDPDDNDIIVYEVPMPAGVNSVMLPSWIAGDYVIQLLWNGWRFWGYIELE